MANDWMPSLRSRSNSRRIGPAAGDFNTTAVEDRDKAMLDRFVRPHWTVAQDVGCDGCKGTSYYAPRDDWSFLDMILFSPAQAAESEWRIQSGGVFIADAYSDQLNDDGTVKRFNLEERAGVSDHLPLVTTLDRLDRVGPL